jgi:hypothetical protein
MQFKRIALLSFFFSAILLPAALEAGDGPIGDPMKTVVISSHKLDLVLEYGNKASITSLTVNGQKVISTSDGIFTAVRVGGTVYSSLHLRSVPVLTKSQHDIRISGISYGDSSLRIDEQWIFTNTGESIKWDIERSFSRPVKVEEEGMPVFQFDNIDTWDGAYQDYGGLAWFYLFNEKLSTYGVHSSSSSFWNSKNGNGLDINVAAPGRKVALKYTRTNDNRLACSVTVSDKEIGLRYDSGTNRRRFIRGKTDVWAPLRIVAGKSAQSITLSFFDFNERYGRGRFTGLDGSKVSAVLNTIARIGVIDARHFGGNSWATPYGPICLHEQYIGQLGLAIDDPAYLKGYQACLDFYRDHAIKADGRVFARWAYTDEDMMPGQGNKEGFYEAQWGILMDANPDLVSNVAELYDLTGDKDWVRSHQQSCEKVLDWTLQRDSDGNGLVEVMTDNERQKRGSDWIDIVWASNENAFVNAKLYHALVLWAAIERQLNNAPKALYYEGSAARLKASFNKSTRDGGFWDEEAACYVHWIDKDRTIHGRNMVTPVNFMAIAYGICDNDARKKLILDTIERQMQQENLFFWPLTMHSYAQGEAKASQYPFPSYENGDLFLSWGAVAVKAYAEYKPDLALKYVKNVLDQYGKDGLAFQRYGRLKQEGLGDDILSGNSLSILGLYQAIYGVNPLYNRFYLNPHITPELAGTQLTYNFRGDRLKVDLDSGSYAVSNKRFTIRSGKNFGFKAVKDQLFYFDGSSSDTSLQVISACRLTIDIRKWGSEKMDWVQLIDRPSGGPLRYIVRQLKPDHGYWLSVDGKSGTRIRSDSRGRLVISRRVLAASERISISADQ